MRSRKKVLFLLYCTGNIIRRIKVYLKVNELQEFSQHITVLMGKWYPSMTITATVTMEVTNQELLHVPIYLSREAYFVATMDKKLFILHGSTMEYETVMMEAMNLLLILDKFRASIYFCINRRTFCVRQRF